MAELSNEEEPTKNYGKPLPYDRNFRGPEWRRRSCTDVPCLLLFVLFLGGWGFIAHYALNHGDVNRLVAPTDSYNRKCGMDSQVLNKKYLFYFNLEKCIDPLVPITGCPTPQVCVESCPTQSFSWDDMKQTLPFAELKARLICRSDADKERIQTMADAESAFKAELCVRSYIKSTPILNRCIFSTDECALPQLKRAQRDLLQLTDKQYIAETAVLAPQLHALALTVATPEQRLSMTEQRLNYREQSEILCKRQTELGETIKKKMMRTNTQLSKLVGYFVSNYYNGTHDAQQIGEEIVEDVLNSAYIVLSALLCIMLASLVFIALMRWLAASIMWSAILGVLVGLVVAVYYSIQQYMFLKENATVPVHALNVHSALMNMLRNKNTWLYLSIALCICFIVILLLVIVLRTRINIAIALTKEGSKAVSSVISTVFFPIFSWALFIAAIVYAVAVGLYLSSIGESKFRMIRELDRNSLTGITNENCICDGAGAQYKVGDACVPVIFQNNCYNADVSRAGNIFQSTLRVPCSKTSCSFSNIENPPLINWFIVYNIFGFFWLTFFISALSDMVLAATFATWYWTFNKRKVPYFTLTRALRQTICYHLGTLAFGSLILAICRMIRVLLEYIDSKLKKYDNVVTRAILCCMRCFFWMLESFLRFLNRNAYIMCAIHGKNFCSSAKDAFNLIMRNFLRVITLDKVTDFLFFLSKVLLTGAAGVATYYFVANNPQLIQLHYNAVPTTIVVIAAFLITSVFFSVYSMAVDTLFLCFLEDCERNDGTPEKPYFMSKQLMKILGKRNKMPKQNNS